MAKKVLYYQSDFDNKVKKVYNDTCVRVRLGDLEHVLKAAKRCLAFTIKSDTLLGGGLSVDVEDMSAAYKNLNEALVEEKKKILDRAIKKISKKFEVNNV